MSTTYYQVIRLIVIFRFMIYSVIIPGQIWQMIMIAMLLVYLIIGLLHTRIYLPICWYTFWLHFGSLFWQQHYQFLPVFWYPLSRLEQLLEEWLEKVMLTSPLSNLVLKIHAPNCWQTGFRYKAPHERPRVSSYIACPIVKWRKAFHDRPGDVGRHTRALVWRLISKSRLSAVGCVNFES